MSKGLAFHSIDGIEKWQDRRSKGRDGVVYDTSANGEVIDPWFTGLICEFRQVFLREMKKQRLKRASDRDCGTTHQADDANRSLRVTLHRCRRAVAKKITVVNINEI